MNNKKNIVLTTFERLRHRLHTAARNIAGHDNADDILQDAFCKLWTLKNLSDEEHAEKIAVVIVKNVSIDYRRIAEREYTSSMEYTETDDSKEQKIRELFESVKKIIELQLNETQRQVLWMRDYEGYSFDKIAERMRISEENARQILSRARKIVRETYKRIN